MTRKLFINRKALIRSVFCLCIGLLFFLMFFNLRPTFCIGESMLPTFHDWQLLAITKIHNNPFTSVELERGDVVIVRLKQPDKLFPKHLIKRLIAMPGDTLEFRDNQVYVNGVALQEPYLKEPMVFMDAGPFVMAEDSYFVMGDNRNNSGDSRHYGSFTNADIVGRVDTEHQPLLLVIDAFIILNCLLWTSIFTDWDGIFLEDDPSHDTPDTVESV